MVVRKPNEHITEYLNWYISEECKDPRFAVLIKGGWGSGKTWFIKDFIRSTDTVQGQNGSPESDFIYLSLYGLEATKDIGDLIFQQLHPIIGSRAFGLAINFVKNQFEDRIAKLPDEAKFSDITKILNKFDSKVLVFDDLERCNIPLEKVFGFINSFIEHEAKKIILIANDEELEGGLKEEQKKQNSKYHQIKEKVIGKTFKIESDKPTVINSLIEANRNLSMTLRHLPFAVVSICVDSWSSG